MSIILAPTATVVDLVAMKAHLRVEVDADDGLIAGFTAAATTLVEAKLKGALVNRVLAWTIDAFPNRLAMPLQAFGAHWLESRVYPFSQSQVLLVPNPPLVAVAAITYQDAITGQKMVLDPATYTVVPGRPGRIAPLPGSTWPATADQPGAVSIVYTAGYGPDATTVPPNLVAAIKLLVGHWYRNREATSEVALSEVPLGVQFLIGASSAGFYA